MKIMVINSGSSSIKYQIFNMTEKTILASGILEQIGETESCLTHETRDGSGEMSRIVRAQSVSSHEQGFKLIGDLLRKSGVIKNTRDISGIGHRVVHGGEAFTEPTFINGEVIETIRQLIPLAPLHNPANLLGMEVAYRYAPEVPQVAVFDTAFHQTIPAHASRYAIPQEIHEQHRIRRYGFHGTSHSYALEQTARFLSRPMDSLNLITLHLGNGASITAIEKGKSVDTSMGMTPLEGLIMGTRSGDIDPSIVTFLGRQTGKSFDEVESLLNKESGLKGICGVNDMREILHRAELGDEQARLAVDMYCYRILKYIGAYYAILGQVDALVFTGGIGENAPAIRANICRRLSHLGIVLDENRNSARSEHTIGIHGEDSLIKILVTPASEELKIAEQTVERLSVIT